MPHNKPGSWRGSRSLSGVGLGQELPVRYPSAICSGPMYSATETDEPELPTGSQLAWPTLEAIRELGGSATVTEIVETVIEQEGFDEDLQAVLRPDGVTTELYHRLAAARTYLRAAGAIESSQRGVWAITEKGRGMSEADMQGLSGVYQRQLAERRRQSGQADAQVTDTPTPEEADSEAGAEAGEDWREQLLRVLLELEPAAFERLTLRLLREAGFINTAVTGRPGDGGIDGLGVYRLSLVSFPVFFQCKRYRGSVGSSAVRDFRGAMAGRGDKGLLITTGNFTSDARSEATRAGAPPIDLIDGDRFCDLLKEFGLGLGVQTVEAVTVDEEFFRDV